MNQARDLSVSTAAAAAGDWLLGAGAALIRAPGSLLTAAIIQLMEQLGQHMGAAWCCVVRADGDDLTPSYLWSRDHGRTPPPAALMAAWSAGETSPAALAVEGAGWVVTAPLGDGGRRVGALVAGLGPVEPEAAQASLPVLTQAANLLQAAFERLDLGREEYTLLRTLIDHIPAYIHVRDTDSRFLLNNRAHLDLMGIKTQEEALGKSDFDFFPEEMASHYRATEVAILESGQPLLDHIEETVDAEGGRHWFLTAKVPIRDAHGQIVSIVGINRDITEQKRLEEALRQARDEMEAAVIARTAELADANERLQQQIVEREKAEAERARLQEEVIEAQRRAIQELSTPVIPIVDGIIILPLVGAVDTARARDITRSLLAGITRYRARVVILDITGVPMVDTGVASHLNRTVQAARLKGAQTIVTGISDAVGETIVDLGIDWSDIETVRDLQTGLVTALKRLGVRLG